MFWLPINKADGPTIYLFPYLYRQSLSPNVTTPFPLIQVDRALQLEGMEQIQQRIERDRTIPILINLMNFHQMI